MIDVIMRSKTKILIIMITSHITMKTMQEFIMRIMPKSRAQSILKKMKKDLFL